MRPRLTEACVAWGLTALILVTACEKHGDLPAPVPSVSSPPLASLVPSAASVPTRVRPGPLCTYHGVCWASPLPQGNALHAVRALAADRVIAVGDRGTVLAWDGHVWSLEDTPTRERLLALVQAPGGDVFAAGEHGTILRRGSGGTWTAMASGTEATLRAIVAVAGNDVLAAGDGLALHFDGTGWTRETLPAADVPDGTSLAALARQESTLYALGARPLVDGGAPQRTVLARDASGWHALSTVAADVGSLCALPEGKFVLSGSSARHGDGRTWQEHSFGTDRPLDAIWCARNDDAWAAGYQGRLAHWDGQTWRHEELKAKLDVNDLDGTSPTDIWAVGEHGLIAHRDATAWTIVSSGTTSRLEGVAGLAREDVWAVGDHVALHYDGKVWAPGGGAAPANAELDALGGGTSALFAVGSKGAIRRYASGAWTSEPSGTTTTLEGVWASDDAHAIAVGGEWTQSDGKTAWKRIPDRPWATAIWGASASDVWAAGHHGLEHWDGNGWGPVAGTESAALFAVWGASRDDVWAAGAAGRVLHYDGTHWSPVDAGSAQDLLAVWGRSASDVWAAGEHGTLLHWDGGHWRWRDSGTDERLHGVWGAPGGETWIVGHGGVVLRMGPT